MMTANGVWWARFACAAGKIGLLLAQFLRPVSIHTNGKNVTASSLKVKKWTGKIHPISKYCPDKFHSFGPLYGRVDRALSNLRFSFANLISLGPLCWFWFFDFDFSYYGYVKYKISSSIEGACNRRNQGNRRITHEVLNDWLALLLEKLSRDTQNDYS